MRVVERKGRTKGEYGTRVIFQNQKGGASRSLTVKGIPLDDLYNKTLIIYGLLGAGYRILIERGDENGKEI